jgi:hypothetical protein
LSKELMPTERMERMNEIVTAHLKGENPTEIAKSFGYKRAEVVGYIDEWKQYAQNNKAIQARAQEAVAGMDNHFAIIIKELWESVSQADINDDYKAKASILKGIADVEGKRVDLLQKAGLLDNSSMGEEVLEMERKQKILIQILREVTSDCPHCKVEVARRLSEVTGRVEAIVPD